MTEQYFTPLLEQLVQEEVTKNGYTAGHFDYFAPSREICLINVTKALDRMSSMKNDEYANGYPFGKLPVNIFHLGQPNLHGELQIDGSLRFYRHLSERNHGRTTINLIQETRPPAIDRIDQLLLENQVLRFMIFLRNFNTRMEPTLPRDGFPPNPDLVTLREPLSITEQIKPAITRRSFCHRGINP